MNSKECAHQDAEAIAEIYNQHGETYHTSRTKKGRFFNEYLEMPATLSLIPENLTGKTVLDAGCGSGIYTREMAKRGAKVIAVDISKTMIEIARQELSQYKDIAYQVGNIYELTVKNQSVDWIICNYVLENVFDIDAVFEEFKRVLKPGGCCVYSISHPLRGTAEKEFLDGHEIWKLKNYYDKGVRMSDFGQGMKVKKYKRTLSDYINASINPGFLIEHMLEPQPILLGKKNDVVAYEAAMRLPQLLIVKMRAILNKA
ncbi:MAG: methyltransferase domain-containing protein [Gammaproteobacteria bacterium]|nr:methyltransferase domain-containing protein [Gammaproteobacteria bacterium]